MVPWVGVGAFVGAVVGIAVGVAPVGAAPVGVGVPSQVVGVGVIVVVLLSLNDAKHFHSPVTGVEYIELSACFTSSA